MERAEFPWRRATLLLPDTFTANIKNRLLRARMIGETARSIALNGITQVLIYHEEDEKVRSTSLGRYITKLLKYAVTPPYLKKIIFPLEETDKYFGVIPPLELWSHKRRGTIRWGAVKREKMYVIIFDGEEEVRRAIGRGEDIVKRLGEGRYYLMPIHGERVIDPKLLTTNPYIGYYPFYTGQSPDNILRHSNTFRVLLSKYGEDVYTAARTLRRKVEGRDITFVVGSPFRCLLERHGKNKPIDRSLFHSIVNVFPDQTLETIHTHEAISIGIGKLLAAINSIQ